MKLIYLFSVVAVTAAGCSFFELSQDDYQVRLDRIEARLDAEIGQARAESVDRCAVLLYGSKPCGGHWRTRVYSRDEGNQTRIVELGEDYTRLQAEMNRKFGLASDCAIHPTPRAALVGGQCVADFSTP
jgi:hypothetical protein